MPINRYLRRSAGVPIAAGLALVMSACTPDATVADGTLNVTGGTGDDLIALRLAPGQPNRLQVDFGDDGTADKEFDRTTFAKIVVTAGDGNDRIRIDQANGAFADEATHLDGGAGDDVILGGDANEDLQGGAGDDTVDGNRGVDQAELGDGNDTFVWDPGDGSDLVGGRAGQDRLRFNGAPVDEVFTLEPDGPAALFKRNVGNIVMELNDVETVDVATLAGFDNVNVAPDMSGTNVTHINVNLAGPFGGPDGVSDGVSFIGTQNPDHITATASGNVVEVAGLPVSATITGAENRQVARDQLQIAAEDPGDTITVDDAVNALMAVLINPHV